MPAERRKGNGKSLELKGANGNNLKNVNVKFPLGKFIVITGVSGSGKSTLINETLYPLLSQHCYEFKTPALDYKEIKGLEQIDKVIEIDQSPIGVRRGAIRQPIADFLPISRTLVCRCARSQDPGI